MSGIFDTHAHYDDERFDGVRDQTLERQFKGGVELIVNCGSDIKSSETSMELAHSYNGIYFAAGIHPHEAQKSGEFPEERLKELLSDPKAVAIGEIGLDYHYDFSPRDKQLDFFERQVRLSLELDLPVVVHDREAHEDTLAILSEYRPKGVVHRFSGDVEMAQKILELGMYLGFGCAVTYKSATLERECAAMTPTQRLLLETDCPYLAPRQLRREACESVMIPYAAQVIAELRGTTSEQLIADAARAGRELFKIQ